MMDKGGWGSAQGTRPRHYRAGSRQLAPSNSAPLWTDRIMVCESHCHKASKRPMAAVGWSAPP